MENIWILHVKWILGGLDFLLFNVRDFYFCKSRRYCSNTLTVLVCCFFALYAYVTTVTLLDMCPVISSEDLVIGFFFHWILNIKTFAIHNQNPFNTKILFHWACVMNLYIWCLLFLSDDNKFIHKMTKFSQYLANSQ